MPSEQMQHVKFGSDEEKRNKPSEQVLPVKCSSSEQTERMPSEQVQYVKCRSDEQIRLVPSEQVQPVKCMSYEETEHVPRGEQTQTISFSTNNQVRHGQVNSLNRSCVAVMSRLFLDTLTI